jgi:hypothetical protein
MLPSCSKSADSEKKLESVRQTRQVGNFALIEMNVLGYIKYGILLSNLFVLLLSSK